MDFVKAFKIYSLQQKMMTKGTKIMDKFHEKPNVFVGEVTIKVQDLEKATAFYQEIIGFKLLKKEDKKVILTANGQTPLLTLEQPDHVIPKEKRALGLYHFAILLPTREDLSQFLRHIIQVGYPIGAADHDVSEALYLNDPDGNGIEVYRDRPSSQWTWNNGLVHMVTEQLDGDGILAESSKSWQGLPKNTIMGHIHLHVADVKKAEGFYTKGLGFNVVSYYPQAAFLSTGNYHHHIAVNMWQGANAQIPSKNSVGLKWYTLVYPNEAERQAVVERLKQLGAPVKKEEDFYMTEDPTGNQIKLVV